MILSKAKKIPYLCYIPVIMILSHLSLYRFMFCHQSATELIPPSIIWTTFISIADVFKEICIFIRFLNQTI